MEDTCKGSDCEYKRCRCYKLMDSEVKINHRTLVGDSRQRSKVVSMDKQSGYYIAVDQNLGRLLF